MQAHDSTAADAVSADGSSKLQCKSSKQRFKAKMQIKQAEVAFEIEKMKNEAELKKLMAEEFNYNLQLKHGKTMH